jgi:hypothetical protein
MGKLILMRHKEVRISASEIQIDTEKSNGDFCLIIDLAKLNRFAR